MIQMRNTQIIHKLALMYKNKETRFKTCRPHHFW